MVVLKNENAAGIELGDDVDTNFIPREQRMKMEASNATRTAGSLAGLAGGEDMAYIEYSKNKKELKDHHPLIQKMYYHKAKK